MNTEPAVALLRESMPDTQAVYLFGSYALGLSNENSDVDLALLTVHSPDAVSLWDLAGRIAGQLGKSVDLVDLRAASTVMQHEIISKGQRLWSCGEQADLFEMSVFSQFWDLNITRHALIKDIQARGSVYGG
jgi:predicted nucleotidyltransferase